VQSLVGTQPICELGLHHSQTAADDLFVVNLPRDEAKVVVEVALTLLPLGDGALQRSVAASDAVLDHLLYHGLHDRLVGIVGIDGKAVDPSRVVDGMVILHTNGGHNPATEFPYRGLVIGAVLHEDLVASLLG